MKKIYYQKELFNDAYRWHIFPLIKYLHKKGEIKNDFVLCEYYDEADIVVLPMSWNYYYKTNKVNHIMDYLYNNDLNKPIYTIVVGDNGNKVPKNYEGFVLRASGDKSNLTKRHLGLPIFVDDPLKKFFNTENVLKRHYLQHPTVGFCGLASPSKAQSIIDVLKLVVKNIFSKIGLNHSNPQKLMSTTYFRYKNLKRLEEAKKITTNFIIRNQYRAGVKTNKDKHKTTIEFYENINNSDYVVCMRGAGNFSNRFYETLAMGRIPVFVNTDCLLPLEDKIDWKKHVVWVEYKDCHLIADKIAAFHSKLDETSLNKLFESNRKLWVNHLQLLSYFKTLLNET